MIRALLIAAALTPALALGQGVIYEPLTSGMAPSLFDGDNGAALDVRFNACGTSPNVRRGGPLAVTRAAAENYVCADGVMRSAGANQLGITEAGAQVYGAGQNVLLNSENPCAWTVRGTATCGAGSTAPDGITTSKRLHVATTANDVFQSTTVTAATAALNSFWIKKVTASGSLTLANPSDGTKGSWTIAFATLGSGWERITPTHPAVTITNAFQGAAGNACGFHFWTNVGGGLDFDFFGGQQEPGASTPGPYHATTAAAVSWPATVVTAPNALTDGSQWCVTADVAFENWPATNGWIVAAGANANSWRMNRTGAGVTYLSVIDGSSATREAYGVDGIPGTTGQHYFTACNASGVSAIVVDGVSRTLNPSGAGSGVLSAQPSTINIGSAGSGAQSVNGLVQRVKLCRSSAAGRCP